MSNVLLIAEIGVNHDGDPALAARMTADVAKAGFDAVKFQYWNVDELLSPGAPNAGYAGPGQQEDLLDNLRLDIGALAQLASVARSVGLRFIITPDGERACEEVLGLRPDALKVGSGDADNPWLLDVVARAGLPAIVSTGMMSDDGVRSVVAHLSGVSDLTFLHCVSAYPAPLERARLGRIMVLREMSGRPVGLSDHTLGCVAAAAAIALGAAVIEKHVTWSAAAPGPDHAMSLPLSEAGAWIDNLRKVEAGLDPDAASSVEAENRLVVRKSLFIRREVAAGARLQNDDLVPLRPLLDGIPAGSREAVVGRIARRHLSPGERLSWEDVASTE